MHQIIDANESRYKWTSLRPPSTVSPPNWKPKTTR